MKNNSFREIADRILDAESIVVFPHVHMDGDALGSSSALCIALNNMGKRIQILSSDDTPANLDFLEHGFVKRELGDMEEYDLALLLDCGALNRIPGREDALNRAKHKGIIDHHGVSDEDIEFEFGIIEPESAATGELVYMLLKEMDVTMTKEIAECLWAAIATDTGNFQHDNTTARTHAIASELHKVSGFSCKAVSNLIYNRNSFNALKLESMVIESASLYDNGRVIIGKVTQKMLEETGTRMDETEGFIQRLMSARGVIVGCLLKEYEPQLIRCSLRSKAEGNVARVAAMHEGGGHVKAAGCTIRDCIDNAEEIISRDLAAELELSC